MQRSEPAASAGIAGPRRAAPRRIVAASGIVLALLLAEAIARIEGPPVCVGRDDVLLSPDDEVGWTFTRGLTVTVDPCAAPGTQRAWTAPVTINPQGLHDQPWPYAKPAGEVRVLLLGDEVADGVGLARADRLSVRLAHLTDRTRGARVAAINGLIPGYGPAEALRFLEKRGVKYAPDVVVLLLDPASDLAAALDPPEARTLAAPTSPDASTPAAAPPDASTPAAAPPDAAARGADIPDAAARGADIPDAAARGADIPPASGLLALSASARWLARRPAATPERAIRIVAPDPISGESADDRARATLLALVRQIEATSRATGAKFAIAIAPRCPLPEALAEGLCGALEEIAPCVDLGPVFADLAATKPGPNELCLPGQPRWGRDAHFLASHRIWDTLGASQLWPAHVVRGHRL